MRAIPLLDAPVSLVGGAVRDALLGVAETEDLDLVVEGDALGLAERLGRELNVRVTSHGRFQTAYLELPHDRWIDIVMARRERYPHPGALPEVEAGTLADDLARRDFTINAMAYGLSGPRAGELVDPHGGRRDLDAGIVRMLRADSFLEDPTRLLRAVRYAARLGFVLEPATWTAARSAASRVDLTSARVGDELKRLLEEPAAAAALSFASELGVPWVVARADLTELFASIDRTLARKGAPRIEAWALRLGLAVPLDPLGRAALDGWARGLAVEAAQGPALVERLQAARRPSELDRLLTGAKPATAVVACALGAERIAEWWATMRDMRLAISGEDLVAAGVAPGPAIGRALASVRAAVLDARVPDDRVAQLETALRLLGTAA